MDTRELIKQWMIWKSGLKGETYSYKALATDAGMSPKYLSSVVTGIRNPGTKTLEKIAQAFGVSMSDFYGGPPGISSSQPQESTDVSQPVFQKAEDNKTIPQSKPVKEKKEDTLPGPEKVGLKLSGNASEEFTKLFSTLGLKPSEEIIPQSEMSSPKEYSSKETKQSGRKNRDSRLTDTIQLLYKCPVGDWRVWADNIERNREEYTTIPRFFGVPGRHVFAVIVNDDSMVPDLNPGDILIINPEVPFSNINGGIGVVCDSENFKIRRIHAFDTDYKLTPSNTGFEQEIIAKNDVILFKVARWIPSMKGKF
ncbi:MAG: helix-turn-helix domain-containing protein [Candidatus Latescibacteria bacterium]|jgi:transcriptional regulator with XRE-family HTH domain|nr:helix-turn-helix domain-containing protein [Candidatus Latescibacterota bacterium]